MVGKKKPEEQKTSKKLKVSTGAWWKSTVVEEELEKEVEQAADVKRKAGKDTGAEQAVKKPAQKRSPRKTVAKSDESLPETASEEPAAPAKTPRKRAPRKKKEPVETVASAGVTDTDIPPVQEGGATGAIAVPAETVEAVAESPRPPRKRPARKKNSIASVAAEAVSAADVAVSVVESVTEQPPEPGALPSAEQEEGAPAPKRAPRKRAPRKKKSEAAAPVESAEEQVVMPEEAVGEVVAADLSADAQAEPVKRAPRKRAPRKKKPAAEAASVPGAPVAAEVSGTPVAAESSPPVEAAGSTPAPVASTEEAEGEVVEAAAVTEEAGDEVGQERKKRRPAHRKSRGRRRGAAKQAEAPVAAEQLQDDLADELTDLEDDEFEDDLLLRGPDRDKRNGYRSGVSARETGAEIPELPEDEESDEEKEDLVLKLLINAEEPEECRLALLENGRLESIHVSTINRTQTKNNIYKGRIVAIEPNLQAAFVDYGTEKNGFLPFSEIHPEYYREDLSEDIQKLVETHHWKKLSITDVMEKGQDVLVQVVKEEIGKKGANMTTYLSLPGRSVVLMPGSDSSGISRKISGEERRAKLRTAMNSLDIPEGIGWIVRTASADITKTALSRDVGYLLRLWEEIKKKAQGMDGVGQVYEDHQSVLRFLREHFDPAIEEILVDDADAMEQVKEFISLLPSKQRDVKVRFHKGSRPIFNQYSVEDQIESIYQPRVNLPSGGSIVIEPTEALVSIDVNSGSTSKGKNFDQSIYQANLEAASELARQLRLRDLGGLIVVDFIDMRNKKHIRDVERTLKQSMKRDKAKVDFSRISKFGLMQISRQKLGSPIEAENYRVCQHCKGRGTVRSVETLALFYLRRIQTGASRKHVGRVECHFPLDVAQYLLNKKRHEIHEHETRYDTEITIIADPGMSPVEHEITLHKAEKEPNEKKQG